MSGELIIEQGYINFLKKQSKLLFKSQLLEQAIYKKKNVEKILYFRIFTMKNIIFVLFIPFYNEK